MGIGKKGVFFTFMCLLLVILIMAIFISQRNTLLYYKQPVVQSRIQSINELYKTLDEGVLPEVLRSTSIQALLEATKKVKTDVAYFTNEAQTKIVFQNLMLGTLVTNKNMAGKTLPYWAGKIITFINDNYHLSSVDIEFTDVSITQTEPWAVQVQAKGEVTLVDKPNNIAWHQKKDYLVRIPIIGMPDPLWAKYNINIKINNLITANFYRDDLGNNNIQTNTTDIIVWSQLNPKTPAGDVSGIESDERINIINQSINQDVFFHPTSGLTAPNYLQRFAGGSDRDAKSGIFAFVNYSLQETVKTKDTSRTNPYHQSYLDFKFIQSPLALPGGNLEYLLGIANVDGIWTETKMVGPNILIIDHIFYINGLTNDFRFKLDDTDLLYFNFKTSTFDHSKTHCKDDVEDNVRDIDTNNLAIYTSTRPLCLDLAISLVHENSKRAIVSQNPR